MTWKEAFSEPCEKSKTELYSQKSSLLYVWQHSKYASVDDGNKVNSNIASLQGFAALESLFYNKVSQIKVQGQQCTTYLRHLSC